MYELIIIGSGPAGISAAMNAKLRKLNFLWLGNRQLSQKITKAERILNYPGIGPVSGQQFQSLLTSHMDVLDLAPAEGQVTAIYRLGSTYTVCAGTELYEAATLILAVGVSVAQTIPGELELVGQGVSYCATCDGNLYQGKRIAVICTDPTLAHEIEYLADLADSVLLSTNFPFPHSRPHVIAKAMPASLDIQNSARLVTYRDGTVEEVDGIFFLKDSVSPAVLLPELTTEKGHIVVDRAQQTNLPGCFAAGDCTGRPYQYAKAVGEGNVALHSALDYLHTLKNPD